MRGCAFGWGDGMMSVRLLGCAMCDMRVYRCAMCNMRVSSCGQGRCGKEASSACQSLSWASCTIPCKSSSHVMHHMQCATRVRHAPTTCCQPMQTNRKPQPRLRSTLCAVSVLFSVVVPGLPFHNPRAVTDDDTTRWPCEPYLPAAHAAVSRSQHTVCV